MSVWYDVKVTAYGAEEHLAKLLNVKSENIRDLNQITLEFGQKNGPGVDLGAIAKNNPDLVLLVKTTIECHSGSVFLLKYDSVSESDQHIILECFDYERSELNRNILLEFPELERELTKNKFINWNYFCYDDAKIRELLNKQDKYQDMMFLVSQADIDFDNMELVDD